MDATVPYPKTEAATTIVDGVLLTTTYQASSVLDVSDSREVTLLVDVNAGSADNIVSILPLLAREAGSSTDAPVATDDVWYAPSVYDGSVSANALSGTMLSGADFTANPEWGRIVLRPTEIRLENTSDAADEIRIAITVRCAWARFFHLQVADHDASGTKSTITVKAVRSI